MMDTVNLAQFALSFLLVIGLIVGLGQLAKRIGLERRLRGNRSQRLEVEETLYIDPRHKLVLLRRDESRHLLLLSASGAQLIESGIPSSPSNPTSNA